MARRRALRVVLLAALALAAAGFAALGVWQLERLQWKRALIARVEARIHAPPQPPPPRADWPRVDAERDGYRRVALRGRYLQGRDTLTQAVTALGAGHWVLSPLRTDGGDIVLVNRGFVPGGARAAPPPTGATVVRGLLRTSEPGGGFLRRNQPAQERWFSRDVAAIARARDLRGVAPYFVDAEATPAAGWPRGGLTVVRFRNHHLQYALTWFGLGAMSLWAAWRVLSDRGRMRQDGSDADTSPPADRHA